MRKNHVLLCSLLIAICSLLPAYDVGLTLDQEAAYSGTGSDGTFDYKGIVIPHFSGLLGENGEFFVSAGLNFQNNPLAVVPELLQTDLFFSYGSVDFRVGRMGYTDTLGFIADGLFDGARAAFDTGAGTFGVGAWYTGLQCKRRANIEMTLDEYTANNSEISYSDFVGTYFAPRRALAALDWEHSSIAEHLRLSASILGQFDATGNDALHSQYLAVKATLPFGAFTLDLGGCFELIEQTDETGNAYAAEAGFSWLWEGQGLSFLARHSSGYNGSLSAFLPLTTVPQGNVLSEKLTGLTMFQLDYTMRPHRTFSFSVIPAYFIDNYDSTWGMMGAEIYGKAVWTPFTDVMLSLGGGAFLPSLGDVAPDAKVVWRAELNVIVSFF